MLVLILHLDGEALAVGCLAMDIVDDAARSVAVARFLLVEILQVYDRRIVGAVAGHCIEEVDEQRLRLVAAEEILKTEIHEGIDVFRHCLDMGAFDALRQSYRIFTLYASRIL